MSAKRIVHFEIMGADGAGLRDFYGKLFDWDTQPVEGFEEYHTVGADAVGVGGAVGQGNEQLPNYVTMYLQVPDIDGHLERIAEAGGTAVVPKTVISDVVTFALFTDPAGNMLGLVEGE